MYKIKLYDHVPKPEPAESGRIVAAHYYPAWTKNENGLNHEFDDIRAYPERTPLMGYYEDKNPEVIDWEVKWALEHGINCFIYCWYRRRENLGKPVTLDGLRLGKGLHEGLFKSHWGEMMKFAIMFETQSRWGSADREDLLNNVLPFWFENYFSRPNYLKIDNKPVVFIYDMNNQLRDELGGEEGMKSALDACREAAIAKGYSGLIFAEQMYGYGGGYIDTAKAHGTDFVFAYNWGLYGQPTDQESLYNAQMQLNQRHLAIDPYAFCQTVSHFWDPEPRIETMPFINYGKFHFYLDFKHYRRLLRSAKALADAAPVDSIAHKMIMVDNINEYDEGHYLFPTYRFGFKHLQCIREELTDRENLPDYRLPSELGFGPYDEVWGGESIDLSEHNRRKLDESEFKLYGKE